MQIKGFLFDLDGVLIDSEESYTRFWADIERRYPTGIPDYPLAIKGTTLSKILLNYPEGEVRDAIVQRIHDFENEIRYSVYEGVYPFLDELRTRGLRSAIVTSSDDVKMRSLFSQIPELEGKVDAIVDGTMITHSKPDPEPYLLGASMLGLEPTECVVMEDSFQGIASGKAAGCAVIGVATTFQRRRLLEQTHGVVDGFKGLSLAGVEELVSRL